MRVLSAQALRAAVSLPECIDAMARLFVDRAAGRYALPLRTRWQPERVEQWITLMPVRRNAPPARWALKHMVVVPGNSASGLDPLQGLTVLHDGDDGRVLAVADAAALTALRTAATSALATRVLAPPDVTTVAVLGTGAQGRAHVEAMGCVLPHARVRLWGRDAARTARIAAETGAVPCEDLREALDGAQVVNTVTAAHEPILRRDWLAPGCHVNAVGSSRPQARELDAATVAAASLFVDQREAALAEAGEVVAALAAGAIDRTHVRAELGEVLAGTHPGRTSSREFTLFKSLGQAAQDLATLELALATARTRNLGVEIPW